MDNLIQLTASIVESHVSTNTIKAEEVPSLIQTVYEALSKLGQNAQPQAPQASAPTPAVTARKSLASREHIISMIDGRPYRTLKKHVGKHGYTPESYREAFNLPATYPMVAPAYSQQRSAMAKQIGLGRQPGQRRGRPKKSV